MGKYFGNRYGLLRNSKTVHNIPDTAIDYIRIFFEFAIFVKQQTIRIVSRITLQKKF